MTNIRCKGGKEIDLLAINPETGEKYHVEARVGTSPSFRIREKDTYNSKGRPHKRGLDYFLSEKFDHPTVIEKVWQFFKGSMYSKVLVVWDVQNEKVIERAKQLGIEIWRMDEILFKLIASKEIKGSRDDILRTIEFMTLLIGTHAFESERAVKILGKSKRFQTHVLQFIIDRYKREREEGKHETLP